MAVFSLMSRRTATWIVSILGAVPGLLGCGTVDLGDNIVPPDLRLDEDFFYCEIQPNILTAKSCAGGGSGEGGMCHDSRSALMLVEPMAGPPDCTDGVVTGGSIPTDYMANFEAIRFTVQSDPLSSPLYRRPTGMDSHPRQIFPETDACAQMIVDWINRGAF